MKCALLLGLALSGFTAALDSNSSGVQLRNGFERVLVQPFGKNAFRVRASLYHDPTGHEPGVLLDSPIDGPQTGPHGLSYDVRLNATENATIQNGNAVASVKQNHLSFCRVEPNGSHTVVLEENWAPKGFLPRYYKQAWPSRSFRAQFGFDSDPNEKIFGTGQQRNGLVDQKGETIDLVNFNTLDPIPVFMSDKGYLFFWNVPSQGKMEFSSLRTRFISYSTTVVDYYVTVAQPGDYDSLLEQYTSATGRSPLMPEFAQGFVQSKLRYENQTELIELAQNFVHHDTPVSLIAIDYFNWAHQGDWGFQEDLWPNPAYMSSVVKNLTGADLMVSVWPTIQDSSVNFQKLMTDGLVTGTRDGTGVVDQFNGTYVRLLDPTNPDSRQFVWETLKRNYYDNGIRNFWLDVDEGDDLAEAEVNVGLSAGIHNIPYSRPDSYYYLGPQEEVGMLYPYYQQMMVDSGQRNATNVPYPDPNVKHISLSRSTWAGAQRFASMVWSGDTLSIWEDFRRQIPAGQSMAAVGIGWWTVDIGGFMSTPTPSGYSGNISSPEYRELFVRWLEWGTFLPIMRVHGTRTCLELDAFTCANEPWSYGEENFVTIRNYIRMRYRMQPYINAIFTQQSQTGKAIMRPLYMDFSRTDPNVLSKANGLAGQYMFGPRLLVAPVTEYNARQWRVYLPSTGQSSRDNPWKYWWTNQTYSGGQYVTVPAALDQIPLFVLGSQDDIYQGRI